MIQSFMVKFMSYEGLIISLKPIIPYIGNNET